MTTLPVVTIPPLGGTLPTLTALTNGTTYELLNDGATLLLLQGNTTAAVAIARPGQASQVATCDSTMRVYGPFDFTTYGANIQVTPMAGGVLAGALRTVPVPLGYAGNPAGGGGADQVAIDTAIQTHAAIGSAHHTWPLPEGAGV